MSINHYQRVLHIGKSWKKEKWFWESMLEKRSMKAVEEEEVGVWITCESLHFATKQGHEGSINNVVIVPSDLPKGRRLPWRFSYPTPHHKWSNVHHRTLTPALQTGAGALPWCSDGNSLHSEVLDLLGDKSSLKFSENVGNSPTQLKVLGINKQPAVWDSDSTIRNFSEFWDFGFWYQLYGWLQKHLHPQDCLQHQSTKSPKCGLTHPIKMFWV